MNVLDTVTKYITAITLTSLVLLTEVGAQTSASVENELRALQDAWAIARVKRDVSFLEKLYAEEFRVTAISGVLISRDQDIDAFASGDLKPEIITDDDMQVALYGDVAIVTGREYVKGTYKGNSGEFTLRFTNVYVRRDGRWQMVTHHGTEVRK